jgi:hypothetical protein
MSSKSRKQEKKRKKARAQRPAAQEAAATRAADEEHEGAFDIPDRLLHAPKETSKLRFALMIGLVIVLLIIFVVPTAIDSLVRGQKVEDPEVLVWERPGHGRETATFFEMRTIHRGLADAFSIDPLLPFALRVNDRQPSLEDAARIHVLDQLALDAGIRLTEQDLGEHLRLLVNLVYQGNTDAYRASAANTRTDVESIIRGCLRVQRFLQLTGYAGALPRPSAIEKAWNDAHEEVTFDFVAVPATDFVEAARAEVPSADELETWLDENPDQQVALFTEERRTAELVLFRDAETTPAAALLEAYPGDETLAPEERAEEYYNRVYARRFVKEVELEEGEEAPPFPTQFESLEDVRAICEVEGPVYFALQAFLDDLKGRLDAGEEIDLAAEAARVGLELLPLESISRDELTEREDIGAAAIADAVFATAPSSFSFGVAAAEGAIGFARVTERVEPTLPPLAEIEDQVVEAWLAPRSQELALAKLRELWEGLETYEPEVDEDDPFGGFDDGRVHRRSTEEEFVAAMSAAGLEVQRRDWLDRGGKPSDDPLADDPHHRFLWSRSELARMDADEVGEPVADAQGETVYLVRVAGKRPVPLDRMTPGDYERFKSTARSRAQASMVDTFDLAFLEEQYGLVLDVGYEEPEEESEEEPEAGSEEEPAG